VAHWTSLLRQVSNQDRKRGIFLDRELERFHELGLHRWIRSGGHVDDDAPPFTEPAAQLEQP
jgi:hypothetical protein